MYQRSEELPEPDEPDPDEEPGEAPSVSSSVPTVGGPVNREFEYRTDLLTVAQIADGKTLPDMLTTASADGWDLVDILEAGDRRVTLFRKPKRAERETRPVGFTVRRSP